MRIVQGMTLFWRSKEVFSNWYLSTFVYMGIEFNCSEQAMMWLKAMFFGDLETAKKILAEPVPRKQKALGREVKGFVKEVWDAVSEDLMVPVLVAKFRQDKACLKAMAESEGTELVEASPDDTIWGIGLEEKDPRVLDRSKWLGDNRLGKVLMRARPSVLVWHRLCQARQAQPETGQLF
jgi:ribA/ribD-fused uncharacterized protein